MASRSEAKQQKEKTSQSLIAAALELCEEEGYASLSLRSVARKAGIAPTSFYRHFREIDEMGVAMADQAREALLDWLGEARKKMAFPQIRQPSDTASLLIAIEQLTRPFAAAFADCFNSAPRLIHLFFQERAGSSGPLRAAIARANEDLVKKLADILKQPGKALPCKPGLVVMAAETMITLVSRDMLENARHSGIQLAVSADGPLEATIQKLNLLLLGVVVSEIQGNNR